MTEWNLSGWTEFRDVVHEIRENYGYHTRNNTVLFRGQPNGPLKSTLERTTSEEFSLSSYILRARQRANELESYTDTNWGLSDWPKLHDEIKDSQPEYGIYMPPKLASYLIYLRQLGYPSPLLDWTTSPYIAAYFAMCEPAEREKDVAIFVYIQYVGNIKSVRNPMISVLGPNVRTHKRHFAQKAQYTMASQYMSSQHIFCSHHKVFDQPQKPYDTPQDVLIKITLPINLRKVALKELDKDYNINHFTLFQTEDSLIKALGMRDFGED